MDKKLSCNSSYESITRNPELKSCFDALPQMVREGIMMSGIEVTSVEQLRKLADNLTDGNK